MPYATALDWFVIMCFGYVTATLLEFAGVHYFTKIGSGETYQEPESDDDEDTGERSPFIDTVRFFRWLFKLSGFLVQQELSHGKLQNSSIE